MKNRNTPCLSSRIRRNFRHCSRGNHGLRWEALEERVNFAAAAYLPSAIQIDVERGAPTDLSFLASGEGPLVFIGTPNDDAIRIAPGSAANTAVITMNGVVQGTFNVTNGMISVDAGGGFDSITVLGSSASESFSANWENIRWLGAGNTPTGYLVTSTNAETFGIEAGAGNDVVSYVTSMAVAFSTREFNVDGGAGVDTLIGPDTFNFWSIQSTNAGTVTQFGIFEPDVQRFTNVEQVTGGAENDEFLVGASIAAINGGLGNNQLTLLGTNADDTFSRTLTSISRTGLVVNSLSNFSTIAISGNGGRDTLALSGTTGNDFFSIRGRSVSVNGSTLVSSFDLESATLFGGNGNDTFDIGASVSAFIFSGDAGNDIFNSQVNGVQTILGGSGTNTLNVAGNGIGVFDSSISGPDGRVNYSQVSQLNVDTSVSSNGIVSLRSTPIGTRVSVTMGPGQDTLIVNSDGAQLLASVDGGGGDDFFVCNGTLGDDTITRTTTSLSIGATSITTINGFEDFSYFGGGGTDTLNLTGSTADDTFDIVGLSVSVNGQLLGNRYTDIAAVNARGGSGNDIFNFVRASGIIVAQGDAGNDIFNSQLNGLQTVVGGSGTNTLNITGNGIGVFDSSISGPEGRVNYSQVSQLNVDTSVSSNGIVSLRSTPIGTRVSVTMGPGQDTLIVNSDGAQLLASVDGGGGDDFFVCNGTLGDDTITRTTTSLSIGATSITTINGFEDFSYFGGGGTDTLNLTGSTADDTFDIVGLSVSVNGQLLGNRYTDIAAVNARGGSGNDIFNFVRASGIIVAQGDAGNDIFNSQLNGLQTVVGGSGTNTLNITGNGIGVFDSSISGPDGRANYSQISQLNVDTSVSSNGIVSLRSTPKGTRVSVTMGAGQDTLIVNSDGPQLLASVDGGGGDDLFIFNGTLGNDTITRTLNTIGRSNVRIDSLLNFEATRIYGSGGVDTVNFIGTNGDDTWTTGGRSDGLQLNGLNLGYIMDLVANVVIDGGTGNDSFNFLQLNASNIKLIGGIGDDILRSSGIDSVVFDGGLDTDAIFLDNQDLVVTVDLRARTGTGLSSFANIERFSSSSSASTILGPSVSTRWTIVAPNAGTAGAINWEGFRNILGGNANDYFEVLPTGSIDGALDGGPGDNTLSYSHWTTNIVVNALIGSASSLGSVIGSRLTTILGGAGDDTLTAANRNMVLVGGDGSDILRSGSVRSILVGGRGADVLFGGNGDDLLIGGMTAHDQNDVALILLLKEWKSNVPYQTRLNHLRGTLAGGLNGEFYLRNGTGELDTLFDDGDVDQLTGGLGVDWFIANLGEVIDLQLLEVVDDPTSPLL